MSLLTELNSLNNIVEAEDTKTEREYDWAKFLKAFKTEIYENSKTKHMDDFHMTLFGMDEFHPFDTEKDLDRAIKTGDVSDIISTINDSLEESIGLIKSYFGTDKEDKPNIEVDIDVHDNVHAMNILKNGAPEIYDVLELNEGKRAFARSRGGKIVRKIRCTAGKRKGRIVNSAAACFKKKNIKLSRKAKLNSKRTRAIRIRKTRLTIRRAISKTVRRLNSRI